MSKPSSQKISAEQRADEAQREASSPAQSVFVAANAGSGKTYILVNRLVRLLLEGVAAERILCLTYTRSAAAHMKSELLQLLSHWASLAGQELCAAIEKRLAFTPSAQALRRAPLLFASALETKEELHIQTIHSFCRSLLARFPLEAGIAPRFRLLGDNEKQILVEKLTKALFALPQSHRLRPALDDISRETRPENLGTLLNAFLEQKNPTQCFSPKAEKQALKNLQSIFALSDGGKAKSEEKVKRLLQNDGFMDITKALQKGSKTEISLAERLRAFLASSFTMDALFSLFLTKTNRPRKKLFGKKFAEQNPKAEKTLLALQEEVFQECKKRQGEIIWQNTKALYKIARFVIDKYQSHKAYHALLDYNDLIEKTCAMLGKSNAAAWVLYKLDGGIEHILIDEAQDTSPAQWEIIAAIAEEFFAGEGASEKPRTLFAVGDEKQSIFSFQGADAESFEKQRQYFEKKIQSVRKKFATIPLQLSRRSSLPILEAVDKTLAPFAAHLSASKEPIHHDVWEENKNCPSIIELWEPCKEKAELAKKIASTIKGWLENPPLLGKGKPLSAGDILILVKNRKGGLMDEILRALKARNIPLAGADRMQLQENIAVMDCLAAANFALLPDDELTLATLLRSPFCGISEGALFELCHERKGSLYERVKASDMDEVKAFLQSLLAHADYMPPYEFFMHLLFVENGYQRLAERLGGEMEDPIEEFLSLSLQYEQDHVPSLQGFIHWLSSLNIEVKRDMEQDRNEVRVMTIHGAKGLEAPIVFLPDMAKKLGSFYHYSFLTIGEGDLIWRMPSEFSMGMFDRDIEAVQSQTYAEEMRLLYVAMTRAREQLYIGAAGKLYSPCWYEQISEALRGDMVEVDEGVYRKGELGKNPEKPLPAKAEVSLPKWAKMAAPVEAGVSKPLTPSGLGEGGYFGRLGVGGVSAQVRGTLIHGLLEYGLGLEASEREGVFGNILRMQAGWLSDGERGEMVSEALAVLAHEDIAPLLAFARAEVPIIGSFVLHGEAKPVSAIVDLWVEGEKRVTILDYKTDAKPAERQAPPQKYLRQLAVYAELAKVAFPKKTVRTGIIWTAIPRLDIFAPELLAQAIESIPKELTSGAGTSNFSALP
ncbi:MAG: UvrD-helicase domain-containing protein [Parvibaculales bacterium]